MGRAVTLPLLERVEASRRWLDSIELVICSGVTVRRTLVDAVESIASLLRTKLFHMRAWSEASGSQPSVLTVTTYVFLSVWS